MVGAPAGVNLSLLAATGIALGASSAWAAPAAGPTAAAPPGIAASAAHAAPPGVEAYLVYPFDNLSGQAALDWLSVGLAAAAAEKLEAHRKLRPAYGPTIFTDGARPFDEPRALEEARAAGARWVLAGTFGRPNWKLQIGLRLYAVEAAGLRQSSSASVVGKKEDAFELLDEVIVEVLKDAGRTPEPEDLPRIRRAATRDHYAFTLFGRALAALVGPGGRPKDLAGAEKALLKATLIDPDYAEAHRLLALVYLALGKPQRAGGRLSRALDLRPDYFSALVAMARLLREGGKRDAALEHVDRALAQRPDDVAIRFSRAELLFDAERPDEAFADLLKVVAALPQHLAARRLLVLIYAGRGDGESLARELEIITAADPADVEGRLDLGAAYRMLGRDADAIGIYEAILQRDARHLQATKFLGDLYKARGEHEHAIDLYQRARRLAPADPRPYFLLGAEYLSQGDDARAERIFLAAQQFTRYLGETYNSLGAICFRRGELGRAVWYLQRAAVRLPDRPKVRYNYALALSASHQRERALEELQRAVALDPADAEIQYLLGVVQLRLGHVLEAEAAFKAALEQVPDHPDAAHNLALIEELRRRATEGERQELR